MGVSRRRAVLPGVAAGGSHTTGPPAQPRGFKSVTAEPEQATPPGLGAALTMSAQRGGCRHHPSSRTHERPVEGSPVAREQPRQGTESLQATWHRRKIKNKNKKCYGFDIYNTHCRVTNVHPLSATALQTSAWFRPLPIKAAMPRTALAACRLSTQTRFGAWRPGLRGRTSPPSCERVLGVCVNLGGGRGTRQVCLS